MGQPSFDCAKATFTDETAICANSELSRGDVEANETFNAARHNAGIRKDVLNITRESLANRHACGDSVKCIASAQKTLIAALSALIRLSHVTGDGSADAAHNQDASFTEAPPAASAGQFEQPPTNPDDSASSAPNYDLDTQNSSCATYTDKIVQTSTIAQVLQPFLKFQGRGEYETSEQFNQRKRALLGDSSSKPLIIEKKPDPKFFKYDADPGVLKVQQWAFQNMNFIIQSAFVVGHSLEPTHIRYSLSNNVAVVMSRIEQDEGSYEAKNGYGAQFQVAKKNWTTMAIFERPAENSDDQIFASSGSPDYVVGTIKMSPADAQRLKPSLKLAFVVVPKEPYAVMGTHSPYNVTIDHREDITETFAILIADFRCGLVLDADNLVLDAYDAR